MANTLFSFLALVTMIPIKLFLKPFWQLNNARISLFKEVLLDRSIACSGLHKFEMKHAEKSENLKISSLTSYYDRLLQRSHSFWIKQLISNQLIYRTQVVRYTNFIIFKTIID